MIQIERVVNGYILNIIEYDEFGEKVKEEKFTYSDDESSDKPEAEAAYSLLWALVDIFGVGGSRYDARRLRIVWEKGDKYDENC